MRLRHANAALKTHSRNQGRNFTTKGAGDMGRGHAIKGPQAAARGLQGRELGEGQQGFGDVAARVSVN